jgi:hypothetical protein
MADALDSARKFLESLHRFDLSTLLSACSIAITQVDDEVLFEGTWHNVGEKDEAVVFAPAPVDAGMRALPPADRKRIGEAISAGYESNSTFEDIRIESIRKATVEGAVAILAELIVHREMMISVAADVRKLWHPEAVIKHADQWARAESWAMQYGKAACSEALEIMGQLPLGPIVT